MTYECPVNNCPSFSTESGWECGIHGVKMLAKVGE